MPCKTGGWISKLEPKPKSKRRHPGNPILVLIFAIAIITLNHVIRKCTEVYLKKINPFMHIERVSL